MPARLSAFVIWALVAATAVFWLLRLAVTPVQAPPQTVAVSSAAVLRGDVSRLLGAPPAAAPAPVVADVSGRFRLIGVMAPRPEAADRGQGIALIAIDGKPARPFRVGGTVEGDLVLQTVSQRSARIGPAKAPATVQLELPPLPPPATGTLPAAPSLQTLPAPPTAGLPARPALPPLPPSAVTAPGVGTPPPVGGPNVPGAQPGAAPVAPGIPPAVEAATPPAPQDIPGSAR
jgi:general secretion pathway protein C